ncbi:MAG: TetR/AcrR family transcriptional regulator [Acidimicrobiales bacterium]
MPNPATESRIRDAALTLFALQGFTETTVRQIAERASVSAGLVIHYYGSKDGLRAACDRHVAELIRLGKEGAAAQGTGLDPLAALRQAGEGPPLARYLVRAFAEGSPGAADLYDQLVTDAVGYLETMVATGVMRPGDDLFGRAVVLTTWSLGALVFHQHLDRLLGVDLLAHPLEPANSSAYLGPALEILSDGVLAPAVAERFRAAFAANGRGGGGGGNDDRRAEGGTDDG